MSKTAMIAKLPLKPGTRDAFIEAFGPMFDAVEAEAGTLVYALHTDATDENTVWVYELYTDQQALVVHASSDAMKAAMATFGEYLAGAPELIQVAPVRAKGIDL